MQARKGLKTRTAKRKHRFRLGRALRTDPVQPAQLSEDARLPQVTAGHPRLPGRDWKGPRPRPEALSEVSSSVATTSSLRC